MARKADPLRPPVPMLDFLTAPASARSGSLEGEAHTAGTQHFSGDVTPGGTMITTDEEYPEPRADADDGTEQWPGHKQ